MAGGMAGGAAGKTASGRGWPVWRGLLLLMIILLGGAFILRTVHDWRPDRADYPVQGVAIGARNGLVHFGQLRAGGADFVYLDATYGSKRRDLRFVENRNRTRALKMRFGAIHHYDLCALASDQAGNFDGLVPRDADALPPAIAIAYRDGCTDHPTQAMLEGELTTFLNQVETHMGRKAILMPSPAIAGDYSFTALDRPLVLTGNYFPPEEGSVWRMWLANNRARINGADGNVRWIVINPRT